ncbi:MAG: MaoC/PaaZ C-terminal domain-containing protein [Parvularculaceae bacterium]
MTIAHGFLTLSMLSKLASGSVVVLEGIKMGVNYGFEKVRFVAPVKSGKRIRGRSTLDGGGSESSRSVVAEIRRQSRD